jgi:hypothetical protein
LMSQPPPSLIAGASLSTHLKYSRVLERGCQDQEGTLVGSFRYTNTNGSPSANNTLTMRVA